VDLHGLHADAQPRVRADGARDMFVLFCEGMWWGIWTVGLVMWTAGVVVCCLGHLTLDFQSEIK
jgi:hypothetical protein